MPEINDRVRVNDSYPKIRYHDEPGTIVRTIESYLKSLNLYQIKLDENPEWNVLAYDDEFDPIT